MADDHDRNSNSEPLDLLAGVRGGQIHIDQDHGAPAMSTGLPEPPAIGPVSTDSQGDPSSSTTAPTAESKSSL